MFTVNKIKLIAAIVLPLLATTLGVSATTFNLLDKVSTDVNSLDHARNEQVVRSAFLAEQKQLAGLVVDNSYWDDAARNVYGPVPNEEWINNTWAYSTADGASYNMLAVVEEGVPNSLSAYADGKPLKLDVEDYFKGQIDALIKELRNSTVENASKGIVLATAGGMAVVGIAPVKPSTADLKVDMPKLRYLILAKSLTDDVLKEVEKQYVINDLKFVPTTSVGTTGGSGVAMLDALGVPQVLATWSDNRPGEAAQNSVKQKAYLWLGLLALVMTALGYLCIKLFFTLGERERRSRHAAFHDNLTNLKNRAGLVDDLQKQLAIPGRQVSLAFIDLDGFKDVNDTYDHNVGDLLIQFIAEGMRNLCHETAFLARAGGDEFVALFTGGNAAVDARKFSENLILFLQEPIELNGRFASVGASIGVCDAVGGEIVESEILRRADVAMYDAKSNGKNRMSAFSPEIDSARVTTQQISSGLRTIIASEIIGLAFQPIVDAQTRQVIGVEVLARWPENLPGNFPPDRFIAVAETAGLIDALGDLILRKACTQARQWPGIHLSINISPVQLRNPDFVSRTLATIVKSGLLPQQIELEITEGVLVNDLREVAKKLRQLREAGIRIALDDFGAGYSSVGYLQQLTFDRIKIDRCITNGIEFGQLEQGIAQGTVIMAKGMTASVVAEGVETEEQAKILYLTGCSAFQGYFFHRPLSAEQFGLVLSAQQHGLPDDKSEMPQVA